MTRHSAHRANLLRSRHDFTRWAVILLLVLFVLAGCQPGQNDTQQAGSSGAKRVVKHLGGETTIEGTPQKIAVLDYRLADSLLALGIKPYAMTTFLGSTELPYVDGNSLSNVIPLGDTPNLEAILQAGPDLIIARRTEEKVYDQLSKIAPTVIVDVPADWREGFKELGSILQRDKEAAEWLANYDKKAADVRSELARFVKPGETFVYLRIMPKEIRLHGTQELFGATLFRDLKLTPAPGLDQLQRIEAISLEKLPDYNADYIFMEVGSPTAGGDKKAEENLAGISQSAVWKNLKAVKNGHVFTMPQWIISDYPHIKSKSLDLILDHFKRSVPGK
ncbi:ABC transporter substrate-binding protein [Paenibacillus hamazuiensis]|uniref:ABC transporter substrate-binding protein n=1 Tax=Paenibacillus hamazuiensis TaxID=2936508 RepID=UPI00200D390F|nr:ABC transporter substrate-binding protein [Paenibacillus hamazuiensis]